MRNMIIRSKQNHSAIKDRKPIP